MDMKNICAAAAVICLLLTIIPAFLVFFQVISNDTNKLLMLIGTIGWFAFAPYWMKETAKQKVNDEQP